ncbi:hypothetical protein FHS10_000354 [Mucilaginibacter dorajii]|nr:hypothetical protein [Mucilaginibacter dorajii]
MSDDKIPAVFNISEINTVSSSCPALTSGMMN